MKAPNSFKNVRLNTNPLVTPRTMRRHSARGITSLPAGKMVPIAAFPLLREDSVRSGRLRFNFEMMETAEIVMNAINVDVKAYLVPHLAYERFNGSMDQLNRSYEGKPPLEGQPVVPYFRNWIWPQSGQPEILKYLGIHGRPGAEYNSVYEEAYNTIWNFRAKNRSPDLRLRTAGELALAPAFWSHDMFRHIVPDFDQAAVDGEVPLNVVDARMPVKGIGAGAAKATFNTPTNVKETGGGVKSYKNVFAGSEAQGVLVNASGIDGVPEIYAELAANGITVSLSNIELARKTQAFAKLRQQYNAHDDWIINLLMDGVSIPEQAFTQPMLLAEKRTIFGMAKRYASDSGNLTESVVNGATYLDMSIQLPRIGVGGVIMIVAEITPDQLFERQEDPYLHTLSVDGLPQYLRDTLDPEKVDVVKNSRIDVDHDNPGATFGYEPLNARWNINCPRVGGRFYRPKVDAGFNEDRQRIWAVETKNPTLSTDFYLCTNIHTKPFVVTNQDPFEVVTQGDLFIEGNTVFGGHLVEATDDYEKVLAVAPQDRIEKP